MHTTSISDRESTTVEPSRPSGRELLRSGQLGTQLIRLAQLATQNHDEDAARAAQSDLPVEAIR